MDLKKKYSTVDHFFSRDLWRMDLSSEPLRKAFVLRYTRVIALTASGFIRDNCFLRASALTFWTLLSFVPLLAMAFGIAKGFGIEGMLQNRIMERFPGQEEVLLQAVSFAQTMLANTKGGVVAGFGVVLLLWSVLKVMGNIENAFNRIWQVQKARTPIRKLSDYLTLMIVCPLLFIISGSVTVYITTMVTEVTEKIALLGMISQLIFMALKLLPYGLIWILFSLLYLVMPNTKVRFSSAVLAGFLAGTGYQIAQWLYILFQVGTSRFNAIYGSFAALPLFLMWLQLSWIIVLIGTEFSFAHQNANRLYLAPDCARLSRSFRNMVAIRIVHTVVRRFEGRRRPLTAFEISRNLKLPITLAQEVLNLLVDCQIFSTVLDDRNTDVGYQPGLDIHQLSIGSVLSAIDNNGINDLSLPEAEVYKEISARMDDMTAAAMTSKSNLLVKDLPLQSEIKKAQE